MSSPLLRLRESSRQFSTTERQVAEHILSDPRLVADMSIHQLARHTFSSASTIVRLCNHTGYSGYKEFRKAVTYELAQREQTKRTEQKEIARSDSLEEIIDKITYQNIISLEETKELLDVDVIRECVEMIKNARVIYLFGLGASLYAAKDAYLKFLRLNKLCIINEDWHSQLLQARGYDHNYVVDGPENTLRPAALAASDLTGITMAVYTTQPGVQFYTANFLPEGRRGKGGCAYGPRHGFCLETQHFPDSPNQSVFPSAILKRGAAYCQETQFRFSAASPDE